MHSYLTMMLDHRLCKQRCECQLEGTFIYNTAFGDNVCASSVPTYNSKTFRNSCCYAGGCCRSVILVNADLSLHLPFLS